MFLKLKGMRDIFGKNANILNYIKNSFFECVKNYNYQFIETPVLENASLFIRAVGETSDIVNKEMYIFKDNGENLVALRPEATASTIRAYVENKINNFQGETRLAYFGPMFRYERPQKGRFRQFYQGGVELIAKKSVMSNFEAIKLASDFLEKVKIKDFVLKINNLGTYESRNKYIQELRKYFKKYESELSDLSKIRLEKNVLRIFDDKEDGEKDFVKNAPILWNFLSTEEKNSFNSLLEMLKKYGIKYEIDNFLVRGLDYYNDVVFEFVSESQALGAKSTILGGGRYNGMIEEFGGPKNDSIGFAFGVDRLMEIIAFNEKEYPEIDNQIDVLIGYLNEEEKDEITSLAYDLRKKYSVCLLNEKTDIKNLFKQQFTLKPKYTIFKELNAKPFEFKIKIDKEKEKLAKLTNLKDFEKLIKEFK
ncbi:histidine--tRNA ligase [Metamycoplasma hyosynoviae]|uniref:histidine--tRNA ligase n=1 Tax=Metamycoplasma hyosynoviae TaxID=29559 RepID=UPI002359848A|nr:histidine--tRNA ligase [Metamycoplasma hyosynoviae]MDC8916881.1 histidine--tRNA ligase [Metamycoplasma hyosynoviae]MDD1359692.1 histidine--tRNA ligase [Metamycoplasma hyosynoviae]MDD1371635.1 histidine--tRNA ligase [Metamycoplasma hyosynoviae]MDD1373903.1 histidine--tRNA ligase [Metamycoplasma hyosynoviae]MDD1374364.1 histidine--tRNA ligase [Metamycoplasma hyosynoviae]